MFKNNVETFEEFKKLMDYQAKGLKLVNDCIGEHQKASSKLSIDYLNMCRKKEKAVNRPLTQEEKIGVWEDNFRGQSHEIRKDLQVKLKEIFEKYKLSGQ